jgi:two-component system response regulator MtrA
MHQLIWRQAVTEPAHVVLIVEDDLANNELMSEVLKINGYRVETASDGNAALELFEKINPSLVVLDVGIPNVGGLEVCRRMRVQSNVPILMVTGRADAETVLLIRMSGANAYLPKPFDIKLFAQQVISLIGAATAFV